MKNANSQSGIFNPRVLVAFALCSVGVFLAMVSLAANPPGGVTRPLASSHGPSLPAAGSLRDSGKLALPTPQAPTGPGWSIVSAPNSTPPGNSLIGVTCISASDCWAVGSYNGPAAPQTLTEHWDGSAWSIIPSPSTSPSQYNFLISVACASTSDCWAVGWYDAPPAATALLEHWNGSAWSIVSAPNGATSVLLSVTCNSSSDCWAAGYFANSNTGGSRVALLNHWDGSNWSYVPGGNFLDSLLESVTCTSTSDCWAVGYKYSNGTGQTYVEHWGGSSWSQVSSPNTSSTQYNVLNAVTCTSASQCWAVGFYDNGSADQTLIERWNGTAWSIVSSPNGSSNDSLSAVTCTSAFQCWAVGEYEVSNGGGQTLIEQWNGTAWSVVSSPTISKSDDVGDLVNEVSVVCTSVSQCWIVGQNNGLTLIEQWNGTAWSIISSPNAETPLDDTLYGVTCASASDCWEVGNYYNGVNQTLIEQWNGTAWSIIASPNTSISQSNYLDSVACSDATDCWAVGYYESPSGRLQHAQTLIEEWDGNSWSIIASPNTSTSQNNYLSGISCNSSSDCWAAGYYSGSANQTLLEHWNGSAWSIASSPNTSTTQNNYLNAVTCLSASECWAVGDYYNGTTYQTLIEVWNGSSWSIASSPNTSSSQNNDLNAVTCVSAFQCWAVGNYYNGTAYQTLILQWNGFSWTKASSPNTSSAQDNDLKGVTCPSASECWAVGDYYNGTTYQTLTLMWNGSSWSIVSSPNTSSAQSNYLLGVACSSTSACWTAGDYNNGSANLNLIEVYSLTVPPLTSVVSELVHSSAGTFDVNLPLTGTRGVEPRSSASLGAGNYTLVFTFLNNLTSVASASVSSGTGSVNSTNLTANHYAVNLTGVSNQQYITITLHTVQDSAGNNGDVVGPQMGVLIGDTTANGTVNSSDIAQTQSQSGQPVTANNFREDVTVNGSINSSDIGLVQSKSGTALPTSP
jgi:hypothetical protein